MKLTKDTNIGWQIHNGSGWNNHETARKLSSMNDGSLPTVPLGYGVLVAPLSDKPFGLRCALVKVQARKIDIINGVEYDDGPANDAGETYDWAYNRFGYEVERLYSVFCEQQEHDDSQYFIAVMKKQIANLNVT